jgi:DNA-binding response OmpR family regulator
MNILLIEDNRNISDFLIKGLEESGFLVRLAETGSNGMELLYKEDWGVILLDIMLPDIDGIELLQYIRYKKIQTPVLIISALGTPEDKVKALESGADDYLTKPFYFKELVARIKALSRRGTRKYEETTNVLQTGNLTLYTDSYMLKKGERVIDLTLLEHKLLKYLLENRNRVVSRTEILDAVWGRNHDPNTNIIDVYISYLRNKIDDGEDVKLIRTVKGIGYMIRDL